jgi:hypothetical protein
MSGAPQSDLKISLGREGFTGTNTQAYLTINKLHP